MDQRPPHKARYTESNKRETGKEPQKYQHRGKFPEQNTSDSGFKINYRQKGSHKIENLQDKEHCQ